MAVGPLEIAEVEEFQPEAVAAERCHLSRQWGLHLAVVAQEARDQKGHQAQRSEAQRLHVVLQVPLRVLHSRLLSGSMPGKTRLSNDGLVNIHFQKVHPIATDDGVICIGGCMHSDAAMLIR